jgi:hypothetical protein
LNNGDSNEDLFYIGRFIGEATKNWSEREIAWAFSQFDSHLQLKKKIDRFYSCEHGILIILVFSLKRSFLFLSRY